VDLDHPYRLIFEVANDPKPTKPDGGLDWTKASIIRILGIEDYHE
jgi:proteic killer suppression protein